MTRIIGALSDLVWRFRHRFDPRHRYHVIHTGLKPGYWDPHVRLEAALFEETVRFVGMARDTWDWKYDDSHLQAFADLEAAALWWKRNRQAWLLDENVGLSEMADVHLHNIIKRRGFMWHS